MKKRIAFAMVVFVLGTACSIPAGEDDFPSEYRKQADWLEMPISAATGVVLITATGVVSAEAAANGTSWTFFLRLRDMSSEEDIGITHRVTDDLTGRQLDWTDSQEGGFLFEIGECSRGCTRTFTWAILWPSALAEGSHQIKASAEFGYSASDADLLYPSNTADFAIELTAATSSDSGSE